MSSILTALSARIRTHLNQFVALVEALLGLVVPQVAWELRWFGRDSAILHLCLFHESEKLLTVVTKLG